MPIDRTMSVSLSDPSQRTIVTFRRTGNQVYVDTWVDGLAREHAVTPAELAQLAAFIGDLAATRWSETPATTESAVTPAAAAAPAPPTPPPTSRATNLPPYPQSARWVPAPTGVHVGPEGSSQG